MPRVTSAGFIQDLEARDRRSQLGWYDDEAEVSIVCRGQRSRQHLRGKSAIGEWIDQTCSSCRAVRVVYHVEHNNEMTVIAEFQDHDGAYGIYSCVAQVEGGVIVSQQVVLQ
ncbi:MAG TPA: hypothetical protein VEQ66_17320 [Propionibacteriaceae bacterium]|nr:hypothetical protein [Propionibacteriaceae bacterium]